MTSYILAPEALQDFQDICDYIATENLDAVDRVIDTLFAVFERLAALSGLGHRRKDLTNRPLRFWTVDVYLAHAVAGRGQRESAVCSLRRRCS